MPGHKGASYLGCEGMDITEIVGADSLYEAEGIIKKSELNASELFGSRTFYSTEGSSHAIRAMLALTLQYASSNGKDPLVWAGRNVHGTFLSAAALLDISVEWLYSSKGSYLSCQIDPDELDGKLKNADILPLAVYVTSPDYLGNVSDIAALAKVCRKHGVLLLVDNAHGAYLKFLENSAHPIDLGADMCCDSAHKTLPVLTGGAYLHLSKKLDVFTENEIKESLRLFGSTSPSYLILQSLDTANKYLADGYKEKLKNYSLIIKELKEDLVSLGYTLAGDEPLKLTVKTKEYGYTGAEIAELLLKRNIVPEFFDPDHIVFMFTPSLLISDIDKLLKALTEIPKKERIEEDIPLFSVPKTGATIRKAMLSPFEVLPVEQCVGRILARASVSCPPAVPILVCGEIIDINAVKCFEYYGIKNCGVLK